jgi:glycosyltransferase involved in cell wall biosynthesis
MMHPAISVIVPVLNTKPYLRQCLDSLAKQTMGDMEIICIDNGSTDGSYEMLQQYASHNPQFTALQHTRGRQGGARNIGVERATGDYIGFVDSDDLVAPEMFRKMHDAAVRAKADVAVCNMELVYPQPGVTRLAIPAQDLQERPPCPIGERPRLLRNLTICNKLFSRALIHDHAIRFPEGQYHEDQLFVIAAFLTSPRIVTLPDALYFYRRQRPGSVNEYRGEDSLHIFHVMAAVRAFAQERGLDVAQQQLLDEVEALKYMQLYRSAGDAYRKTYFKKMQLEIRGIAVPLPARILSASEHRECEVIRRNGYVCCQLFLLLRAVYGKLRSFAFLRPVLDRRSALRATAVVV